MYSLFVTAKLNDIDPQAGLAGVLARTLSAFKTAASVLASAAPRMRTVAVPIVISIEAGSAGGGDGADGAASISTGVKIGAGVIVASATARNRLRQPNNCWELRS